MLAMITGASAGIGAELAHLFAADKHDTYNWENDFLIPPLYLFSLYLFCMYPLSLFWNP